jgi:hypothetical protein
MNKKSATEFLPFPSRPFEPTDEKDTHHLSSTCCLSWSLTPKCNKGDYSHREKSTTLHNMHNTWGYRHKTLKPATVTRITAQTLKLQSLGIEKANTAHEKEVPWSRVSNRHTFTSQYMLVNKSLQSCYSCEEDETHKKVLDNLASLASPHIPNHRRQEKLVYMGFCWHRQKQKNTSDLNRRMHHL